LPPTFGVVLLGRLALDDGSGRVEVFLDRHDHIQELLDFAPSELLFIGRYPLAVQTHLFDHPPVGVLEVGVVLEEVAVAEHVRDHELVREHRVVFHQKRLAWIGVKDDLVDLRHAVFVGRFLSMVVASESPV
jgi:hypothetical protein